MYFCLEYDGPILYRILHQSLNDNKSRYKNILYNEIPLSKMFGYIGSVFFESMKRKINSYDRIEKKLIDLIYENPIEYDMIYKNNYSYDQGKAAATSDYSIIAGKGYGAKPSNITHMFHKQILFIFKFEDENKIEFLPELVSVWNNAAIELKGTSNRLNKSAVEDLNDFHFKFDDSKIYYRYVDYEKSGSPGLSPNKMTFICDYEDLNNSILIDNLSLEKIDSVLSREDLLSDLDFRSTSEIL